MVLTQAASKSGDETVLRNEQRSNEQKIRKNATFVTDAPEDDDDEESFESFEPATHKSIIKETTKPTKHYHIRRKQNGQRPKHKSTTTISPKLMNYYNMKNDYY